MCNRATSSLVRTLALLLSANPSSFEFDSPLSVPWFGGLVESLSGGYELPWQHNQQRSFDSLQVNIATARRVVLAISWLAIISSNLPFDTPCHMPFTWARRSLKGNVLIRGTWHLDWRISWRPNLNLISQAREVAEWERASARVPEGRMSMREAIRRPFRWRR
ncbi:hypothetical protein EDD16DRAFT_1903735 [Pisolithus croceorrhizus]|nr:hypothetical protein EDD16DRAFT_1903735 [Pisolithus croceorrhizus]KAI6159754.1 hypothetical protein EDD17DRAFT_1762218 [Pisolithus thermaeus]